MFFLLLLVLFLHRNAKNGTIWVVPIFRNEPAMNVGEWEITAEGEIVFGLTEFLILELLELLSFHY